MAATAGKLDKLLSLALNRARESRGQLMENVSDLFLSEYGRLSDRERALMSDILSKLVGEMETLVRRNLAERLAMADEAPKNLVTMLANDEIEVARSLLMKSHVLEDPDLVEIVKFRTQEHRIAIAQREGLSAEVTSALLEYGDEDVIATLIENGDAEISEAAQAYLVEQSRRLDRFQEPLLRRSDLPAHLAHRMFWWVSAALRRHILDNYTIEETRLDDALEATTKELLASQPAQTEAEKLVERLYQRRELKHVFLVHSLRNKQLPLFIAALARFAGLDRDTARRIVLDQRGECLAVACKGANLDRNSFAMIYMLTRHAHEGAGGQATDPRVLEEMLGIFDKLTVERAQQALRHWMRDKEYLNAIDNLERRLSQERAATGL